MTTIQIDMFEVQLGAALLLQFRTPAGGTVRVLADAGVKASGYARGHVHAKLAEAFANFGDAPRRLDLVIGTHYDEDHLEGLVPIIEDASIEIGEAWLPPVANDTEMHALEDSLQDHHLLANQFAESDGEERLDHYLQAKREICQEIGELERRADDFRSGEGRIRTARLRERADALREEQSRRHEERNRPPPPERVIGDLASGRWTYEKRDPADEFRVHLLDADATLGLDGDEHTHADEEFVDEASVEEAERDARYGRAPLARHVYADAAATAHARGEAFKARWQHYPPVAEVDAGNLAFIRRAAAKDAINAISLAKVVSALKARGIPMVCRVIRDGTPRRFVWRAQQKRFVPGAQLASEGPDLMLLGPSEGLVKKHWSRLPIGDYLLRLASVATPIKTITPSNQLSYVARFGVGEEGVLVAGDAGCVDFKAKRGAYYPELLHALLPLHVIQVAHHAGNNAHFYRALLEADYPGQEAKSLLLVSHATHDKHRPSKEFGMFVEDVRREGDDVQLLFTSEPSAAKVRDYRDLIHPVVGAQSTVGDVRVEFDGREWRVAKHAVKV